jgi:hypothetical protein
MGKLAMPSLMAQAAAPAVGALIIQAFGLDAAMSGGGGDHHQRRSGADAADDDELQDPSGPVLAAGVLLPTLPTTMMSRLPW